MFNKQRYVIFCTEHYNPLGVIRSLGEQGILADAIIINGRIKVASASKYLNKIYFVNNYEEGYKVLLEQYGKSASSEKIFVFTCDDKATSYLDIHFDEIKDKFYFNNAGCAGRITKFMNKYAINLLAEKHGLKVLDNIVTDLGVIPDAIKYPVITKAISSNSGGWKEDVFVCQNEMDLKKAFEKIKSPQVLLQKYLEKKNELCLDGFAFNKGKGLFISIASTYNYLLPSTYSSYMTVKNFTDNILYKKLREMFAEIEFEGIFSVEFLVDKSGELYFLEINFRNSTWSYASTCAGMNLPVAWSYAMQYGELPQNFPKKIPDGFKAMVELSDFKARVLGRKISLLNWLKDLKYTNCKFYYNKKDPKPFWSFLFSRFNVR